MSGKNVEKGKVSTLDEMNLLRDNMENYIERFLFGFPQYAEHIPGGFFVYHEEEPLEMLYVNQRALDIFGCETLEEFKTLTGYTFRGLVHPDDFDIIQASINEQIANKNNKDLDYVEYRIIRKDGAVRWVDDYGYLARSKEYGNLYYVFISDITEKKLAMQTVRAMEKEKYEKTLMLYESMLKQFHSLADESLSMIRLNLTTGVIEEVRGKDTYAADYVGGSILECRKERDESFLIEGDRERYAETFRIDKMLERNSEGEGPATFVGYCKRASGRRCFVKFSGTASINPGTGDTIVFGVETEYNMEMITDVMNSKILAKQYDMVSYIVSDYYEVVIGNVDTLSHGRIFPKEKHGSYMDYIKEQVLPVASAEHDMEKLSKAFSLETIEERLRENESYTVDVACEIDGRIYNKRFMYYEVDRKSKFYICLKTDVTDVLREEKIRNEQLKSALNEANQANIAKTTFLSSMSHEIRTPMNAIIGLDSIALQEYGLSENTRDYLEKIGISAKHLLGLINDILDMSRIESGRMVMKKEEFSFRNMLEQINTMISSQCQDKGLSYDCMLHGRADDHYIGDETKLKQVLLNILGNAVKFTPAPGTVSFTAECISEYEDMSTFRFVIKDTGIGMDKEYLPKLFDVFSQEDATAKNIYGGSGLGMSITRNIVEMMSGSISVQSEKGVGTEFTVIITLKNSDRTKAAGEPEQKKDSDTDGAADLTGKRILVAEDIIINAEIMLQLLKMKDMEADWAENGQVAVEMFEKSRQNYYDAILMDVRMPVMNGLEATDAIRNLERADAKTVPIIAMTANAFDEDVQRSLQAGMNAHLSKPIEMERLYETLENLIVEGRG